jgi:hypothetical protein
MFGFQLWFTLAVLISGGGVVVAFAAKGRRFSHRLLLAIGTISAAWAFTPLLAGRGLDGQFALATAVAFGALAMAERR